MSDLQRPANLPAPRFTERAVRVRGVRVTVAMSDAPPGQQSRIPLVVLPSMGFVWQDYGVLLDVVAPRRATLTFDWPGFGASEHPSPENFAYTADSLADLVNAVLDALGVARAVMLGNGMGAAVAVHAAQARPVRVLGLCLMGPTGFRSPGLGGELMGNALGTPGTMRLALPTLLDLALGPNTDTTRIISDRLRASQKLDDYRATVAAAAALWRVQATAHADELRELAGQVTAPSLVVRGELDPLCTQADSRRAAEAMGSGTALEVVLPGAGHLPFLQEPERFVKALDGLLATADLRAMSAS